MFDFSELDGDSVSLPDSMGFGLDELGNAGNSGPIAGSRKRLTFNGVTPSDDELDVDSLAGLGVFCRFLIAFFWPDDDCFSTSDADDSESDELGDDFRGVFERFLLNFLSRPTPDVDGISWSEVDELETNGCSSVAISVLCPKFSRRITDEIG